MSHSDSDSPSKAETSSLAVQSKYSDGRSTAPATKEKGTFFVKPWGPRYRHRVWLSWKRWGWLKFLIIAAIVLVVTLPIIYVLYPKLSQQGIDDTTVTVEGLGLGGPTADTYLFSINSTLYPKTSFNVNLDAFNVSLYLTDYDLDTPFTTVTFPPIYVDAVTTVNITEQQVTIQNTTLWELYLQVAFTNSTYRVTTKGHPDLRLGALPKNKVNYYKTLEIPGYGGLTDITTTNMTVVLGNNVTYDFYATANVQNPSPSTVVVGNITYDCYLAPENTYIGQTFLNDVVLGPGANVFPFKSATSQTPVVLALQDPPFCSTGEIEVTIVPFNVTYDGQFVPWLMPSLHNVTQTLLIVPAIEEATHGAFKLSCPNTTTSSA